MRLAGAGHQSILVKDHLLHLGTPAILLDQNPAGVESNTVETKKVGIKRSVESEEPLSSS